MKISAIFTLVSCCICLTAPTTATAQTDDSGSVVTGEIIFEENVKRTKTYVDTEAEVIDKLDALAAYSRAPSGLPELQDLEFEDDHLLYLNALYLFCSVNRGTCPEILDSILETDIIRSAVEGNAQCITLKKFWKSWLDNDMQRRHQYQVRTGYLRETEAFKKNELPRYLRCSETVKKELSTLGEQTPEEFLKERYHLPSKEVEAFTDTLGTAETARKEKVDLIRATGTRG